MLETFYVQTMGVLFPTKKLKERFLSDKKISLSNDRFKNMIGYPKSYFKSKKFKKSQLFAIIKKIIEDHVCRALHPNWIIIFYKELESCGYKFYPIDDALDGRIIFEIRHDDNNIDIRKQINECFKIHTTLLSDACLKEILGNKFFNYILTKSKVEDHVKSDKIDNSKYIDMIYDMGSDNYCVPIEIQEDHHNHINDNLRKNQIFAMTGKKLVLYYIEDETFEDVYDKIMESFSKVMMNLDKEKGITLYFTKINKWNLEYSKIFSKLYNECVNKNIGYSVSNFLIDLERKMRLKDPLKIINNMLIENELDKSHFMPNQKFRLIKKINKDGKIKKELIGININSLLNIDGVNTILQYPRNNEWKESKKVKKYYSQFMVKYIEMIEVINTDNLEDQKILRSMYIKTKNIFDLSNYFVQEFTVKNWERIVNGRYKGDIKLHPVIPFLVKEKGNRIQFSKLEKLFGKEQVKKWKVKLESKKSILNYRQINHEELNEINKSFENLDVSSDETDSELEDL